MLATARRAEADYKPMTKTMSEEGPTRADATSDEDEPGGSRLLRRAYGGSQQRRGYSGEEDDEPEMEPEEYAEEEDLLLHAQPCSHLGAHQIGARVLAQPPAAAGGDE